MRTTILAIAAALVLVLVLPFSSYARGGGYTCKTPAECEERQAARDKRAAEWKAEQAEQKAKDEAEEKAEQAKTKKALAAGLEQVKHLAADDQEINSWLRANPRIKVVRVLTLPRDTVLIFYRNK